MQVEGDVDEDDLRKSVEQVIVPIVREIGVELDRERANHPNQSVFPNELIALALFGAYERATLSSPLSSRYRREDLLTAYLWLFLAAQAARNGEIDIDSRLARHRRLYERHRPAVGVEDGARDEVGRPRRQEHSRPDKIEHGPHPAHGHVDQHLLVTVGLPP